MRAAAFDTLSAAQDLEAAGFERPQAEAIARAINHHDERAATKADLDTTTTKLEASMTKLASQLDARIASLKEDMLKVAIGVAVGVVLANATLTAVLVFGALRMLHPA